MVAACYVGHLKDFLTSLIDCLIEIFRVRRLESEELFLIKAFQGLAMSTDFGDKVPAWTS